MQRTLCSKSGSIDMSDSLLSFNKLISLNSREILYNGDGPIYRSEMIKWYALPEIETASPHAGRRVMARANWRCSSVAAGDFGRRRPSSRGIIFGWHRGAHVATSARTAASRRICAYHHARGENKPAAFLHGALSTCIMYGDIASSWPILAAGCCASAEARNQYLAAFLLMHRLGRSPALVFCVDCRRQLEM